MSILIARSFILFEAKNSKETRFDESIEVSKQ